MPEPSFCFSTRNFRSATWSSLSFDRSLLLLFYWLDFRPLPLCLACFWVWKGKLLFSVILWLHDNIFLTFLSLSKPQVVIQNPFINSKIRGSGWWWVVVAFCGILEAFFLAFFQVSLASQQSSGFGLVWWLGKSFPCFPAISFPAPLVTLWYQPLPFSGLLLGFISHFWSVNLLNPTIIRMGNW